ncbi:MAG: 4-(cytidine 5'-diphospho)-2-C-methyl-D-erythritol kinase, partial [bacterium]
TILAKYAPSMKQEGSSISIETPAKINLTLEVLGKRADGYHALRSVVMPVSLTDAVTVTTTNNEISLTVTAEPWVDLSLIGPPEKNLCIRVTKMMQARYRIAAGAKIHIHKRIPIGGGMGGGSADAAAVIRGLNELWELDLPRGEMMELGAELGSDIPALVHGGAVLMEGRGEFITGLFQGLSEETCRGFWLVVANPGIPCSTAEVFKNWKAGLTPPPHFLHNMISFVRTGQVTAAADVLYNGLEEGVFERYPLVAQTASQLKVAGCFGVLLSGSGSSVFGLVRDEAHGQEVCKRLDVSLWRMLVRTCPVV